MLGFLKSLRYRLILLVLLASLLKKNPAYNDIGAINPEGYLFASAIPFRGPINLTDRLYFQEAVKKRDFVVGEVKIGRITGKPCLFCAYPVLGQDGKFVLTTNTGLPMAEVAQTYKSLWRVERTFREQKSTLEVRPIYHQNEDNSMGHIVASFLALRLEVYLQQRLEERQAEVSWPDLMRDLKQMQSVHLELDGQHYQLPTDMRGAAHHAFAAAGVRPPSPVTPFGGQSLDGLSPPSCKARSAENILAPLNLLLSQYYFFLAVEDEAYDIYGLFQLTFARESAYSRDINGKRYEKGIIGNHPYEVFSLSLVT